jgi:cold shock protein
MSTRTNTGIVKWLNAEKGFGLIQQEKGLYVFVHNSHFRSAGIRALTGGQKVQFNNYGEEKRLASKRFDYSSVTSAKSSI